MTVSDTGPFALVPIWLRGLVTPTQLAVYVALAWRADTTGECFPSHKTIAKEANVSVTSVKTALNHLRELGAVSWVHQQSDDGDRTSNLYSVHRVRPGWVTSCLTGGSRADGGVGQEVATNYNHINYNHIEPPAAKPQKATKPKTPERETAEKLVNEFWEAANPKPAVKWIALVQIVERLLEAGWQPENVAQALPETKAYTLNALEFQLKSQGDCRKLSQAEVLKRFVEEGVIVNG